MRFIVLCVAVVCYGGSKAWAKTLDNFEVYNSISSHDSTKNQPPSFDEFLKNMSKKYSTIDKEIEELQHNPTLKDGQSIDCHSSKASKMLSIKAQYDFCNELTEELKKLKNASISSLQIISEISYTSSELIASGIQCTTHPSASMQLNCFVQLFLHSRLFFHEITPKFHKLMNSLHVFANLITIDTFYCLFHHSIDSDTVREIAQTWLKCEMHQ